MSASFTEPPVLVSRVAELMSSFAPPWALCGGWAVDAWLGRETRSHGDIDVTVFQEDQGALFKHLAGWDLIGHDDNVPGATNERWNGRWLDLPAHVHARPPEGFDLGIPRLPDRPDGPPQSELEVVIDERAGEEWVFRREPRITLPLTRCVQPSRWGVPTVTPEVILFYKALPSTWRNEPRYGPRAHDDADLVAVLPRLSEEQRDWVRESIGLVEPGHPWVARLDA